MSKKPFAKPSLFSAWRSLQGTPLANLAGPATWQSLTVRAALAGAEARVVRTNHAEARFQVRRYRAALAALAV